MIRLLIADDHAVVRTGLEQLVATFDGVELVGAAGNGEDAVRLAGERRPDVVLMDIEMPGLDGIEATRRITADHPEVAIVVLTSFSDREQILRALDAGAVAVGALGDHRGARRNRVLQRFGGPPADRCQPQARFDPFAFAAGQHGARALRRIHRKRRTAHGQGFIRLRSGTLQ